jgi:hypothetical protein
MPKKTTLPVRTRTQKEFDTTRKYLQKWDKSTTFADFLLQQKLAQATRCKHLRQANTLQKRGEQITGELGTLSPYTKATPPRFSDSDFTQLYEAFLGIDYPRFIQSEERHRY